MSKQFPNMSDKPLCHKPNFLFIMVDQQRYPVVYENEELKAWSKKYL